MIFARYIRIFLCGALFLSSLPLPLIGANQAARRLARTVVHAGIQTRVPAAVPRLATAYVQIKVPKKQATRLVPVAALRSSHDQHARFLKTQTTTDKKVGNDQKRIISSEHLTVSEVAVISSKPAKTLWQRFLGLGVVASILTFLGLQEKAQQEKGAVEVPLKRQVTWDVLNAELDRFAATMSAQFSKPGIWAEGQPDDDMFNLAVQAGEFKPFAQKLIVPAGSKLIFFGDLHGEVDSAQESLKKLMADGFLGKDLRIKDKNGTPTYIIFLGDYVDRGQSGVEVIDTLLRLKNANPERMFMVRGNHEDAQMNFQKGGFSYELRGKFGKEKDFDAHANKVFRMYDLLPNALFVGCQDTDGSVNWIQGCHGGLEFGYNPQTLFQFKSTKPYACSRITTFDRAAVFKQLTPAQQKAINQYNGAAERLGLHLNKDGRPATLNGHMWTDFIPDDGKKDIDFKQGRGWAFGQSITAKVLEIFSTPTHKLRGIFRAHQHNGKMLEHLKCSQNKGCVQLWQNYQLNDCQTCKLNKDDKIPLHTDLWDGIVCTFLSTPVPGTNFKYHAYGQLTTAARYEDWRLEIKSAPIK